MSTIHERTVELIPWYVNGTLEADERRAVERHLAECLPCRAALRDEQRLGDLVHAHGAVPPGAEHGLSDLLRTIDTGQTRGARRRLHAPTTWGIALAAAVIMAVLVLPALIGPGDTVDSGAFATLTDSRATDDLRIDIVFADDLTDSARDEIVRAAGGRIVAGPTALGRYTIALDETRQAELDRLIENLREDPRIRFVGRNFIDTNEPVPEAR